MEECLSVAQKVVSSSLTTPALVKRLLNLKGHTTETELQNEVERRLKGLDYKREHRLDRYCRIDFLVGNIGIECKHAKQNRYQIQKQVNRYLSFVDELILVTYTPVALSKTRKRVYIVNAFKNI